MNNGPRNYKIPCNGKSSGTSVGQYNETSSSLSPNMEYQYQYWLLVPIPINYYYV